MAEGSESLGPRVWDLELGVHAESFMTPKGGFGLLQRAFGGVRG